MKRRVVITGIGTVSAAGMNKEALWDALVTEKPLFTPIEKFNTSLLKTKIGAQIPDFKATDWITPILARQTDRSTHFAIAAVQMCLKDAGIDISQIDETQIGIMVGHALGGMNFSEPNLYNSWFLDPSEVSPYQAIAWFYAAAQGQVSIATGIKGYSKSFSVDRISGLHALGQSYNIIAEGKLEACITGGTEAPFSPFICLTMEKTGRLSSENYTPLASSPEGCLLGEGACFMAMESLDFALARNANILAEVKGIGMATDCSAEIYGDAGTDDLLRSMNQTLADSGVTKVEHIFADGTALAQGDKAEIDAIKEFSKSMESPLTVSVPKAIVGEMYAAGAPTQVAAGILSLQHQTSLPLSLAESKNSGLNCLSKAQSTAISHVLINSRGFGGLCGSLLIGKYN